MLACTVRPFLEGVEDGDTVLLAKAANALGYKIVTEHGDNQIVTRPRSTDKKRDFYARHCRALKSECDVEPSDVIVSLL
jgi:hypothetical protein